MSKRKLSGVKVMGLLVARDLSTSDIQGVKFEITANDQFVMIDQVSNEVLSTFSLSSAPGLAAAIQYCLNHQNRVVEEAVAA